MVKNDTVPISKRSPVPKVRKRLKKLLSTWPKSHVKRAILTINEIERKIKTNAFNAVNRFGKNLDHISVYFRPKVELNSKVKLKFFLLEC